MPPLFKSLLYPILVAVLTKLPDIVASLPAKWQMLYGAVITAIGAAVLHQMQPPASSPPTNPPKQ